MSVMRVPPASVEESPVPVLVSYQKGAGAVSNPVSTNPAVRHAVVSGRGRFVGATTPFQSRWCPRDSRLQTEAHYSGGRRGEQEEGKLSGAVFELHSWD